MIPGASVKDLVPESPNEKEDGITQITIGQLFKPGITEYTRIGAAGLRDTPPLPTGYVLFKDLVFRVKTEAVTSGYQLTVFNLPSADNESDFNKLIVFHLEDNEMSPLGRSWNPVIVAPGGWDESFHFVSKAQYEALEPDFEIRRLATVTHGFGTFLIAQGPPYHEPLPGRFTQFEVTASSSPDPAVQGEEVTHTIVVKNAGPKAAAEVDVKVDQDADFGYKGSSTQGACKQSRQSTGNTLCYLGAMPAGATVTITIVGRVSTNLGFTKELNDRGYLIEVVFKANPTDLIDADNAVIKEFNFRIQKKE